MAKKPGRAASVRFEVFVDPGSPPEHRLSRLDDLTPLLTKDIAVRITAAGNVLAEKAQWRVSTSRYAYRASVRLWGSDYHPPWWAVSELSADSANNRPVLGNLYSRQATDLPLSVKAQEPNCVRITYSKELHEHLWGLKSKTDREQWERNELRRRRENRVRYAGAAKLAVQTSLRVLTQAERIEEAEEAGRMHFTSKGNYAYRQKEALRRWPEDLTMPSPGDAGALGELALLADEED
jgi:hypothetical protein